MKSKRILWSAPSFSLGDLAYRLRCARVLAAAGFAVTRGRSGRLRPV